MWRRRPKPERRPPVDGDDAAGYCGFCNEEGHRALHCTALDEPSGTPYAVPLVWPLLDR